MVNRFEILCNTRRVRYGNIHIINEWTIIDEELVYIIRYVPCRIRHCHIYFDRFSISNFHKDIIVESHKLVRWIMCQIRISW